MSAGQGGLGDGTNRRGGAAGDNRRYPAVRLPPGRGRVRRLCVRGQGGHTYHPGAAAHFNWADSGRKYGQGFGAFRGSLRPLRALG